MVFIQPTVPSNLGGGHCAWFFAEADTAMSLCRELRCKHFILQHTKLPCKVHLKHFFACHDAQQVY